MLALGRVLAVLAMAASTCSSTASAESPAEAPRAVDAPAIRPSKNEKELIRGTHLRLTRPAGFEVGERFAGFQQDSTGATVVVVEFEAPYSKFSHGMTAEGLATQKVILEWRKDVKVGEHDGLLMAARQDAFGITFEKWLLVFGDGNRTFLITANYPAAQSKELSPQMYSCVLSAEVDHRGGYDGRDAFADLSFRVTPVGSWRFAGRMADAVIFTQSGSFPKTPNSDPGCYIVCSSITELPVNDRKQFAVQRLVRSDFAKDVIVQSIEPIAVDGLSGYEIVGSGQDEATARPLCVYQTMLFEPNSTHYVLLSGLVAARESESALEEFKSIARSFRQQVTRK